MSDTENPSQLPPDLKLLKGLVTVLTVVMICGMISVVTLLVLRFPKPITAPEELALPDGATPQAITQGENFWAVVTEDNRILIFGRDGILRQDIAIMP